MRNQKIGVEIELDGLDTDKAAEIVAAYFGGEYDHLGRKWSVVWDSSVSTGFELVSPPIYYADLFTLQELFRRLRQEGARRSSSAGIHVHASAEDLSLHQLMSLVNLYASHADLIVKMLNVYTSRRVVFSQPIYPFAKMMNEDLPTSVQELRSLWYDVSGTQDAEDLAHESRYTEVNLNSYFRRGTIEFRVFNSTNHAGKIRSFILLVLAMLDYAKHHPTLIPLSPVRVSSENEARAEASRFFDLLSLAGQENRNLREHFCKSIQRHYRRTKHGTKPSLFYASTGGLSFDGGSFSEVVDEMADNGYFDQDDVLTVLRVLRKRGKALAGTAWAHEIANSQDDQEAFAMAIVRCFEAEGLGTLKVMDR